MQYLPISWGITYTDQPMAKRERASALSETTLSTNRNVHYSEQTPSMQGFVIKREHMLKDIRRIHFQIIRMNIGFGAILSQSFFSSDKLFHMVSKSNYGHDESMENILKLIRLLSINCRCGKLQKQERHFKQLRIASRHLFHASDITVG